MAIILTYSVLSIKKKRKYDLSHCFSHHLTLVLRHPLPYLSLSLFLSALFYVSSSLFFIPITQTDMRLQISLLH